MNPGSNPGPPATDRQELAGFSVSPFLVDVGNMWGTRTKPLHDGPLSCLGNMDIFLGDLEVGVSN